MSWIHSAQTALAPHYYEQDELIQVFVEYWQGHFFNPQRIVDFQRNVLVGGRYLALEKERYQALDGLGAHNDAYLEVALPMAEQAVTGVLAKAGIEPADVDLIASTTVTGLAVPSLEARLMNRLPFRSDTRRMPLFGFGCAGGSAGVNRVAEYLQGHPDQAALLLSVELCSLTVQREDLSVANIVATGLFGDGGAAVLMVGDEHPLAASAPLRVLTTRASLYPESERVLGWDIVDAGFKVVLAPTVADHIGAMLPVELAAAQAAAGIDGEHPTFVVGHPGGPKVIRAVQAALSLDAATVQPAWDNLMRYGNLSSASVLFLLADTLEALPPDGALGVTFAFGPGFCCELALLRVARPGVEGGP